MTAAIASALHLFALVLGLPGVFLRGRAMKAQPFDRAAMDALLRADNAWGVAALLWIATGLWRLFGGLEKSVDWYLHNPMFHAKLGLFGVVFMLELFPMVVFIRWRIQLAKNEAPDTRRLATFRVINTIEVVIVAVMVLLASGMARGVFYRPALAQGACGVQQLVRQQCTACHGGAVQQASLALHQDWRGALVGVPSATFPGETRVLAGNPSESLLIKKLKGQQGALGTSMPPGVQLHADTIAVVEAWIAEGAPPCTTP